MPAQLAVVLHRYGHKFFLGTDRQNRLLLLTAEVIGSPTSIQTKSAV
jgi:hypothetical protein